MNNMNYDIKTLLREINYVVEDEVDCIKSFLCKSIYNGSLFKSPVSFNASIQDISDVPIGNGIYIFKIVNEFTYNEFKDFNFVDKSIKATRFRDKTFFEDIGRGSILYIGSCKVMGIRARLKEHLFYAGNGVYSLRLYEDKRKVIKEKVGIICFEMNTFDNQDYAKLLLPSIEEELQKALHPVAGRYRG